MSFKPVDNPVDTLNLTTPIQYLGEAIEQISIKEPSGQDFLRYGFAVKIKTLDPLDVDFDQVKCINMISSLSGLPVAGTLDRMKVNDMVEACYMLLPFFIAGYFPKPQKQPAN